MAHIDLMKKSLQLHGGKADMKYGVRQISGPKGGNEAWSCAVAEKYIPTRSCNSHP